MDRFSRIAIYQDGISMIIKAVSLRIMLRSTVRVFLLGILLGLPNHELLGQEVTSRDSILQNGLTISLNDEGTAKVKFITLLQTWARYTAYNPGTVYKGKQRKENFDIAIRRIVLTSVVHLNPRVLLLLNLSGTSNSGDVAFQQSNNFSVLDAYGEYKFNKALFIGAGLHQWTGFSRLNIDGVGSLLNLDQPSFQQITWNRLDRLGRFLGIYAKGELGGLHYRISLNEAYSIPSTNFSANTGNGSPSGGYIGQEAANAQVNVAYFNPAANSKIIQGYFSYAFWERESHIIPYEVSTYNGAKKLLNLGAGFLYRKNGMLNPSEIGLQNSNVPPGESNPNIILDAEEVDISAYALDLLLLYPFSSKLDGVALYLGYFHTDLGPNYYSVTNLFNNTEAAEGVSTINGSGNAYPATGTGNTGYVQLGYILPNTFLKSSRLGIFATYQYSDFEALRDPVQLFESGLNWFVISNRVKLTLMYRNRPIYAGNAAFGNTSSDATVVSRKGEIITQFQLNF